MRTNFRILPSEASSDLLMSSDGHYGSTPHQLRFRVPLSMGYSQEELTHLVLGKVREDLAERGLTGRHLQDVEVGLWTYPDNASVDTYGQLPDDYRDHLYIMVRASRHINPDTDRELCVNQRQCICIYDEACPPGCLIQVPMRVETHRQCPQHGTYRSDY